MKKILYAAIAVLFAISIMTCSAFADDVIVTEDTVIEDVAPEALPEEAPEAKTPFDFVEWLKNDILPKVISLLTVSGVGLVYLIPVLFKVKKASGRFDSSSDVVEDFVKSAKEKEEKLYEALEELEAREAKAEELLRESMKAVEEVASSFADTLKESEANLAEVLNNVETMGDKIERMIYLGMTNHPTLVSNGTARKIAEVEEETR
ncbi:MAG: hypothetical protein J6S14_12750 [Clostridia bacterium]|nr:hypothetical protein [Clostridia bacterium]